MSKLHVSEPWTPRILGRERLDERRWVYAVWAPFEMASDVPDLIGVTMAVDGREFEVRGTIPKIPRRLVGKGEVIELLVVGSPAAQSGAPFH